MNKIKVLDRYITHKQAVDVIKVYYSLLSYCSNINYTQLDSRQIQSIIDGLEDVMLLECALSEVLEN